MAGPVQKEVKNPSNNPSNPNPDNSQPESGPVGELDTANAKVLPGGEQPGLTTGAPISDAAQGTVNTSAVPTVNVKVTAADRYVVGTSYKLTYAIKGELVDPSTGKVFEFGLPKEEVLTNFLQGQALAGSLKVEAL